MFAFVTKTLTVSTRFYNFDFDNSTYAGAVHIAINCSVTLAHTGIECVTPEAAGVLQAWEVEIGGQWSGVRANASAFTSFESPFIGNFSTLQSSNDKLQNFATQGGDEIIVHGVGFGPPVELNIPFAKFVNTNLTGMAAGGAADCTVWDHETLHCVMPEGVGYGHSWTVTVAGQQGFASQPVTSYSAPSVTSIEANGITTVDGSRPLLSTAGGETVILSGHNFGPNFTLNPVSAIYYPSGEGLLVPGLAQATISALDCVVLSNHTQVACTSGEGVGVFHTWSLVVGGQKSSSPENITTSYRAPHLSIIFPGLDLDTAGGELVTISGVDFGPISDLNFVSASYTNAELTGYSGQVFNATDCEVTSAHVEVSCRVAEGNGHTQTWEITIGGQGSEGIVTTSYAVPLLEDITISPEHALFGFPTEGGGEVLVQGHYFGPSSPDNTAKGYYQNSMLSGLAGSVFESRGPCRILNHTAAACEMSPGVGFGHSWWLSIAGVPTSSSNTTTSYTAPDISVEWDAPKALSTLGYPKVVIPGTNFGPQSNLSEVSAIYRWVMPNSPPFLSDRYTTNLSLLSEMSKPAMKA